jgi:hypothetical protein
MTYGTPEEAHELLGEYYPALPGELRTDDTNALLGALLMELRTDRLSRGGPQSLGTFLAERQQQEEAGGQSQVRGKYTSVSVGIDAAGWTPVDLNSVSGEIDLRNFSADLKVAFADPTDANTDAVPYAASEAPVVGIKVRTEKVWLRSQVGAGSQTVRLDAWGDA